MKDEMRPLLSGEIVDDAFELNVTELCQTCRISAEQLCELVEEGIVEPLGSETAQWRFRGTSIYRVRRAVQLHRDLGINWAGAALALELLDELHLLRARLRRYED